MDGHFLLQGIFPTQESNLGLLHCRQMLYRLSHQESVPCGPEPQTSLEGTLNLSSEGWGGSQPSKEGVNFVGKECKSQHSCGAKKERKQEKPGKAVRYWWEEAILLQTYCV